jgi:hypothetical protein
VRLQKLEVAGAKLKQACKMLESLVMQISDRASGIELVLLSCLRGVARCNNFTFSSFGP